MKRFILCYCAMALIAGWGCHKNSSNPKPVVCTLKGYVTITESHGPIPGVLVTCDFKETFTSDSGYFEIGDIAYGRPIVTAHKDGYHDVSFPVHIAKPETTIHIEM